MAANHIPQTDNDRGANLIEMAFATVLLLILLAGVVDVGRAFYSYMELTNAAREGARHGSRVPFDTAGIEAAVRREGPTDRFGASAVTGIVVECTAGASDVSCAAVPSGGSIRVTATAGNFETIMSGVLGTTSFVLRSSNEMIVFGVD